jgi:hypothetical protein
MAKKNREKTIAVKKKLTEIREKRRAPAKERLKTKINRSTKVENYELSDMIQPSGSMRWFKTASGSNELRDLRSLPPDIMDQILNMDADRVQIKRKR